MFTLDKPTVLGVCSAYAPVRSTHEGGARVKTPSTPPVRAAGTTCVDMSTRRAVRNAVRPLTSAPAWVVPPGGRTHAFSIFGPWAFFRCRRSVADRQRPGHLPGPLYGRAPGNGVRALRDGCNNLVCVAPAPTTLLLLRRPYVLRRDRVNRVWDGFSSMEPWWESSPSRSCYWQSCKRAN